MEPSKEELSKIPKFWIEIKGEMKIFKKIQF